MMLKHCRHSYQHQLFCSTVACCILLSVTQGFVLVQNFSSIRTGSKCKERREVETTEGGRTARWATLDNAEDEDELDELSRALLRQSSGSLDPLNHLFSSQRDSTTWYKSLSEQSSSTNLPFECTGCGKCCQTKGEVYLDPSETKNAASILNVSIDEFKNSYVAREEDTSEDDKWTVLKQKRVLNDNGKEITQCIFLNDNMQCNIYEARPLQCSTYPFWPRIMDDINSWNNEVVQKDDDLREENYDKKIWSYEDGGCEGMYVIGDDGATSDGVSINEAVRKLETYKSYKRRFPTNQNFIDIQRD